MKKTTSLHRPAFLGKTAGLIAGLLLLLSVGRADSYYSYTLDTTALTGQGGLLAFDLIDGDATVNNLVKISGLSTDGTLTDSSDVVLADTSFFTEELRELTFGTTLSFNVLLTENFSGSGFFDQFSFFLLDPVNYLPLFSTSDPLGADALFAIDIDGNAGGAAATFAGRLSVGSATVPDSGNVLALLFGAVGLLGLGRKVAARRVTV